MHDKSSAEKRSEIIKQKIIMEKGWFVPTLHEKYLQKDLNRQSDE